MKLRAYSVYDRKAFQYHPPYFSSTDGAAVRSFADLANDTSTQVGRHPGDFVLFYVGEYDDSKGEMLPMSPIGHVIDAMACVKIQTELPIDFEVARNFKEERNAKPNGGV